MTFAVNANGLMNGRSFVAFLLAAGPRNVLVRWPSGNRRVMTFRELVSAKWAAYANTTMTILEPEMT